MSRFFISFLGASFVGILCQAACLGQSAEAKPVGSGGAQVIPVWPDKAPGSESWTQKEVEYRNGTKAMVRNVTTPTLTVFAPDPKIATGAAVIICPGGGYRFLSWDSEGVEVAKWLQARGVAAFVLKYRLVKTAAAEEDFRKEMALFFQSLANRKETPDTGGDSHRPPSRDRKDSIRAIPSDMREIGSLAVADGRQAVKVVRDRAREWGIKTDRIGIMGFSAGALVTTGVVMDHDEQSRPNFAAPIYGGGTGGVEIAKDAPPLFILCASDDHLAALGSLKLYSEWKGANRPVELHLYEKGGHGFGMNKRGVPIDTWIDRFGDWLAQRGLIKQMKNP